MREDDINYTIDMAQNDDGAWFALALVPRSLFVDLLESVEPVNRSQHQ